MEIALTNLRNFKPTMKLQLAAISFIVNQMADKEEVENLNKVFRALDKNNDGKLSERELL